MVEVRAPEARARGLARLNGADLGVVVAVLAVSALPLYWFVRNWRVPIDGSWYLAQAANLLAGNGYTVFGDAPQTIRGPVMPSLLAGLMAIFGRDTASLAGALRVLAVANPLLLYILVRRVAGRPAAALAAVMVTLFGYIASLTQAFNIDSLVLTVFLLATLVLLAARDRDSAVLAFLSGVLLGTAILTKETAILALPLAAVAALLLDWDVPKVARHYLGVLVVCVPWWVWVWWVSGAVYLAAAIPGALLSLGLVLATALAIGGVLLYRRGTLAGWFASEQRRRMVAWALVLTWSAAMGGALLLAGSSVENLGQLSPRAVLRALNKALLQDTPAGFLLPLGGLYALWQTVRGRRMWSLYLALVIMWMPTLTPVLAINYASRQWLAPQTLLFGALAALVVSAVRRVPYFRAHRAYAPIVPLIGISLIAPILVLGGQQIATMLTEDAEQTAAPYNMANAGVRDMHEYIARNVPAGESIVMAFQYSYSMAYMDGLQHRWILLDLDCVASPRGLAAEVCLPSRSVAQAPPPQTVWFQMSKGCEAVAASLPTLQRQMDAAGTDYLLLAPNRNDGPLLEMVDPLVRSGAFTVAHASYLRIADNPRQTTGLVLLKRTGQPATPPPTSMETASFRSLVSCRKSAAGDGYAASIRASFPNGIALLGENGARSALTAELQRIYGAPAPAPGAGAPAP